MSLPVTALYAGLLGLIFLALSVVVIQGRGKHRVGLGDGGNADMTRRIRMHGNFFEFVPLLLVLMALIEANGGPAWGLHAMGIVLLVARIAHPLGIARSAGTSLGRAVGAGGTMLLLVVASLWAIAQGVGLP